MKSECEDCMYYAPGIIANSDCLNGFSLRVSDNEPCDCFEERKDKEVNT
jgi:hypothetical protein